MNCTKKELERARKYRETNRDLINSKRREYYKKHRVQEKEISLPRAKKWYQKNKIKKKEYDIVYKKRIDVVARNLFLWMKYRMKRQKAYHDRKIEIDIKDFVEMALSSSQFKRVFRKWKMSGYDNKLRPTVDRRDNDRGYAKDNIQFISMIDNVNKFWRKDKIIHKNIKI